jgi:hypothetical protein
VIAAAAAPKLSGFTALSSKRSTATKTTPEPLSEVAASLTTRQLDTVHIRPKRTRSAGAIGLLHPEKFQASPQIRGEKR